MQINSQLTEIIIYILEAKSGQFAWVMNLINTNQTTYDTVAILHTPSLGENC